MEKFHNVDAKRGRHPESHELDPESRGNDHQSPRVLYIQTGHLLQKERDWRNTGNKHRLVYKKNPVLTKVYKNVPLISRYQWGLFDRDWGNPEPVFYQTARKWSSNNNKLRMNKKYLLSQLGTKRSMLNKGYPVLIFAGMSVPTLGFLFSYNMPLWPKVDHSNCDKITLG